MGHLSAKDAYETLRERLDRFPMGAPGEATIRAILRTVYSEEDAALAAKLRFRFESAGTIARRAGLSREDAVARLADMADRGLVLDVQVGRRQAYMLTPTVVGFFEFSMMRVRDDLDQAALARLFHQYLLEEPDFFGQFRRGTRTTPFRTLVHEEALAPDTFAEVLDWERASALVAQADRFAVGLCHCRHVAHHAGRDCRTFRMESCLTLGAGVDYVVRHGFARLISREEAQALLAETRDAGMVHIADNVQRRPAFICNCCSCCCELLNGFKTFRASGDHFGNVFSSNFEAAVTAAACTGCRRCEKACPVGAITMVPTDPPRTVKGRPRRTLAVIDRDACIGCGVCALRCPDQALAMTPRPQRRYTPPGTLARVLLMAIEQGKLGALLFDPEDGLTARLAGVLLDGVLGLPPAKQLLAQQALRSRFVDALLAGARRAGGPTDL
jgi:ferredoxin